MKCIQCDNPRAKMRGTLLCEDCLTNTAKSLKSKLRDVETFNEDRREFLFRKNKELNIGHTEKEIISMIDAGMTDAMILSEEALHIRSEEHTSELQSRGHLVCRLLLEKKKKHRNSLK